MLKLEVGNPKFVVHKTKALKGESFGCENLISFGIKYQVREYNCPHGFTRIYTNMHGFENLSHQDIVKKIA